MIESLRSKVELLEARLETVSGGEGGREACRDGLGPDAGFVGALSQFTAPTSASCEFQGKVHIYLLCITKMFRQQRGQLDR